MMASYIARHLKAKKFPHHNLTPSLFYSTQPNNNITNSKKFNFTLTQVLTTSTNVGTIGELHEEVERFRRQLPQSSDDNSSTILRTLTYPDNNGPTLILSDYALKDTYYLRKALEFEESIRSWFCESLTLSQDTKEPGKSEDQNTKESEKEGEKDMECTRNEEGSWGSNSRKKKANLADVDRDKILKSTLINSIIAQSMLKKVFSGIFSDDVMDALRKDAEKIVTDIHGTSNLESLTEGTKTSVKGQHKSHQHY